MFDVCDEIIDSRIFEPTHIFSPAKIVIPLVTQHYQKSGILDLTSSSQKEINGFFDTAFAIAQWRLTQGIYRFDQDVYEAVISTEKQECVPFEVIKRLPEWCVFIETPGLTAHFPHYGAPANMYGCWLHVGEIDDKEFLCIYACLEGDQCLTLPYIQIDMTSKTLRDGVNQVLRQGNHFSKEQLAKYTEDFLSWLVPVLNLVLYLCANCEISDKDGELAQPSNPKPKKIKKGQKIFPPARPAIWDVAVRMGAAMRHAKTQAYSQDEPTGRTVRPHIRSAHWRHIVSGKRKTETGEHIPAAKRQRELRWIPPIAVKLEDYDELPAVVRQVK